MTVCSTKFDLRQNNHHTEYLFEKLAWDNRAIKNKM